MLKVRLKATKHFFMAMILLGGLFGLAAANRWFDAWLSSYRNYFRLNTGKPAGSGGFQVDLPSSSNSLMNISAPHSGQRGGMAVV